MRELLCELEEARRSDVDRLIRLLVSDSPEGLKDLFADDPRDAIATDFDLNNAPTDDVIEATKRVVHQRTQEWLKRQGFADVVTVWRGGPLSQKYVSVTTQKSTAQFFGKREGYAAYEVQRSDILIALDAFRLGTFAEMEMIVDRGQLVIKEKF